MTNTLHNDSSVATRSSRVIAAIIGVAFIIALLLLAFLIPTPSASQYEIFRIVLALAAAGFAAILPGTISAKFSLGNWCGWVVSDICYCIFFLASQVGFWNTKRK